MTGKEQETIQYVELVCPSCAERVEVPVSGEIKAFRDKLTEKDKQLAEARGQVIHIVKCLEQWGKVREELDGLEGTKRAVELCDQLINCEHILDEACFDAKHWLDKDDVMPNWKP